jgi:hypothetical protein
MRNTIFWAGGFLATLVVGCGAEHADDHEAMAAEQLAAGGDGRASGLRAEVTQTNTAQTNGRCAYKWNAVQVRLPNAAAARAINAALAVDIHADLTGVGYDCTTDSISWSRRHEVTFNERGLLSIRLIDVWTEGSDDTRPARTLRSRTFDLRNGQLLDLENVVNAAGEETIVAECRAFLQPNPLAYVFCKAAVDGDEAGPPVYVIEAQGLRLHPSLNEVDAALELRGVVTPWSALRGQITHDSAAAIAGR